MNCFAARLDSAFARMAVGLFLGFVGTVVVSTVSAAEITIPANIQAEAQIIRAEREGLWEKTLVVTFPEQRRTLGTFDGLVEAKAVINHSAHPLLWQKVSKEFMNEDGLDGRAYIRHIYEKTAGMLKLSRTQINAMATAADMDNLAVVTKEYGPLSVTVLATAGAKSNAIRTGVDAGTHIEGESNESTHGTINIMVLTNAQLTDGAMARTIVTVTEGKTAAMEDLKVPSTYTNTVQATGTGTDSVVVVSGTTGPRASIAGGHSRIGELIGKATYEAVVEALGKQNGFFLPGAKRFTDVPRASGKAHDAIRVALLHLDVVPGDVSGNRSRIEAGIKEAVAHGADWVMTPELAETGYNFSHRVGTDWIAPFPDTWITTLAAIARDNRVALFIGFAERDGRSGKLHNSVAVIDHNGLIQGAYRKQVVHGRAEAWSTPGAESAVFTIDGISVGMLICADAYKPDFAARYKQQGAAILLSSANWPPVAGMEPEPYWEARTRETGLPLVVNNRTGKEPELDFSQGPSGVVFEGKRLFSFQSPMTRLFYIDWDKKQGFVEVAP
ncbi:MAG: adenosylcobinamide amidohydrolase [Sterolibacterium sp.]